MVPRDKKKIWSPPVPDLRGDQKVWAPESTTKQFVQDLEQDVPLPQPLGRDGRAPKPKAQKFDTVGARRCFGGDEEIRVFMRNPRGPVDKDMQ